MDLLNKLTIKNLKLNKKRTIVTIIGIMLSVALIYSVATMYSSAIKSLIHFETYEKGNFHVVYYDVNLDDVSTIKNNRGVEEVYLTKDIGYAKLEDSKNEYKPYIFVKGFDEEALENLSIKLVEGRLPENENEIVIPTHLKTNGRVEYHIGDTITLEIGTRVSNGEVLTQNDAYSLENNEKIVNTESKTYKIVGIIERPATNIESYEAPGYTFITYMDEEHMSGNVHVYARYNKKGSKNYLKVTANILGVDEEIFTKIEKGEFYSSEELEEYNRKIENAKYQYDTNSYLITLENNPFDESTVGSLGTVVIIVCLIIVGTSIFCIKNSFDISITEKTKQYGMLRSVGATKKQIRHNVFYEATILGLIGIPLGLLVGFLASDILIIISNIFMKDMLDYGLKLVLSYSFLSVLVAVILGIITIYFSAFRSARRASRVSPIDSIRNSANIKIHSKKIKSPKVIQKLFGVGGSLSYKNLKRNKKKYRTTVISIVVSVFAFIALSSFMNMAFDEVKNELNLSDYNISFSIDVNGDNELFHKVLSTFELDNIEDYSIVRSSCLELDKIRLGSEYKKVLNISDDDYGVKCISVVSIGDYQYQKYIKNLGLEYEEVKDKGILIDMQKVNVYNQESGKTTSHLVREYAYTSGNIVSGKLNDNDVKLEIASVSSATPFGLEENNFTGIIVSDEFYDTFVHDNTYIKIFYKSNNANKLQDDIDELLDGENYSINNIEENARIMNNLFTLIGIFLYGFIIVISLIGITNIFNTITTNMELRRQEFAMLKSIGMTKYEFNRMIRLESIFMGLKSLLFGIPIGIGLSYLIYHFMSAESGTSYRLPIFAIVISILVVFILISVIMKYEVGKINKQNTIETIRNENI